METTEMTKTEEKASKAKKTKPKENERTYKEVRDKMRANFLQVQAIAK